MSYYHEVDLLLSCTCIAFEKIEGAFDAPLPGEQRHCNRHDKNVTILKVGYPYRVDVPDETEKINIKG